jgi:integrase
VWKRNRPALVLLMLDAGLRFGEALGLRWGAIVWGESDDDSHRRLVVAHSRPRGGTGGPTKSRTGRLRTRDALIDVLAHNLEPPSTGVVAKPVELQVDRLIQSRTPSVECDTHTR